MSIRFFSSFITKTKNPCINCIHYIKYKYLNPHDELYYPTKTGKCSIFGKENLVTGEPEYEDALTCRINITKCGKEGKYYKEQT